MPLLTSSLCFTLYNRTPCLFQHEIFLPMHVRFDGFHCIYLYLAFTEAADIAYEMMLQEDTSSMFTNYLCLYTCIKRFQQIGDEQPAEDEPIVHDEVG